MLSDSQKRLIQKMWRKNYTSGQIAESAKTTRGAVMGYVHRAVAAGLLTLKTVQKPKPVTVVEVPKVVEPKPKLEVLKSTSQRSTHTILNIKNRIENATLKRQQREKEPPREINSKGVPLLKLREHHCRHIFDDVVTYESLYCGREMFRRSYCEEHYLMFYVPSSRKLKETEKANNTVNRVVNRSESETERSNRTIKKPNDQIFCFRT